MGYTQALNDTSKLTYAALRAEQVRQRNNAIKIAPATYASYGAELSPKDGTIELSFINITLHGHHIATLYDSGALALYTCGHETGLTRSRIAPLLRASTFDYGVCIRMRRIYLTTPARYIPVQYRYEAREIGTGLYIETDGTVYDGGYSNTPLYAPEPQA